MGGAGEGGAGREGKGGGERGQGRGTTEDDDPGSSAATNTARFVKQGCHQYAEVC